MRTTESLNTRSDDKLEENNALVAFDKEIQVSFLQLSLAIYQLSNLFNFKTHIVQANSQRATLHWFVDTI